MEYVGITSCNGNIYAITKTGDVYEITKDPMSGTLSIKMAVRLPLF